MSEDGPVNLTLWGCPDSNRQKNIYVLGGVYQLSIVVNWDLIDDLEPERIIKTLESLHIVSWTECRTKNSK